MYFYEVTEKRGGDGDRDRNGKYRGRKERGGGKEKRNERGGREGP